jgi:biotin carboxylase
VRPRTIALLAALAAVGVRRWRQREAHRPPQAALPPGPPVVVPPVVVPPSEPSVEVAEGVGGAEPELAPDLREDVPEPSAASGPVNAPVGDAGTTERSQDDERRGGEHAPPVAWTPAGENPSAHPPEEYGESESEPEAPAAPRPLAGAAAAPLVAAPLPDLPAPEPDSGSEPVEDDLPSGWEVVEVAAPVAAHQAPPREPGPLRGISEIRRFFRTNEVPVWFVSATAFNLLGIDRWVRRFTYVNYYDSFDGTHPNVFAPTHLLPPAFESIEEINAYLLSHKEVIDRIRAEGGGKALFLMFDEEVERLAVEAGLEVAFPPAALRQRLDSKIETTRLGNEAGVPSVPNVLGRARSFEGLISLARGAGLGDDLVVQTPYGDSGQTTFFIASEADWDEHRDGLVDEHLKVMKRISCREAAIEGVITRHGTLVGPLMTELTGFPELTPYGGGWCGNDVFASALTPRHRELAREFTRKMGERLAREGYRGYFELDFLADMDSGELYLGELNPRVTGASSMTNVTAVAYGDMPLFLFHLLEFMDVDYEIDVEELNEQWSRPSAIDEWSQFILKDTADKVELITAAPASGIWRLDAEAHGGIRFVRRETDWHTVASEDEAFYLRIAQVGGYRYPGADIGILVTRGRLQTDDHELTDRARTWITGIKKQFGTAPLPTGEPEPVPEPGSFSFKML